MTYRPFFTLLSLLTLAAPVVARPVVTRPIGATADRPAIRLTHIDRHPATRLAARKTLARIDRAALEVCGAAPGSLREMKEATHRSACWHEAMAGAVAKIDNPLLNAAFADRQHAELGG